MKKISVYLIVIGSLIIGGFYGVSFIPKKENGIKTVEKTTQKQSASAKPKEEVIITQPVSNDLLTGAYLSWQKPDDYAGKKPEIRKAVFEIKITRLDNEKLVFLDSNGKDTTDCTWKEKPQKYQGQWEKDGKVGFIEFTPIYKNGKIVSFCGAMGSKNKKPNSFCWITGDIP